MSIKIEQLIVDLIKIPQNFRTIIPEYFNTYDVESLGLTYTNIYTDIQILVNNLSEIYTNILKNLKNAIKIIQKNQQRYKSVLDHLRLTLENINKIKIGLEQIKYTKFEHTDQSVIDFINSINEKVDDTKTTELKSDADKIIFKNYLKNNIELYQAYYDTIYIYIFINKINKLKVNIAEKLIFKISDKYLLKCRYVIYQFQQYKEKKNKTVENSKLLISLLAKKNISLTELYDEMLKNDRDYNILIKSNITLHKLKLENDKKITLPKFHTKNIEESILTKTVGLCNPELYNILNHSNLPICYSNKSFLTLYNDLRINLRGSDNTRDNSDALKLIDNIFITTNNYINLYSNYLGKGYFIETNYNDDIYFSRDAIIDIDFSMNEYKELDKTITACKNRYIFIYCSQVPFNQKGFDAIKQNLKGGHKVSLLIDKEKKEILFFDPFGMEEYNIYNNCVDINVPIIYTILALELAKNLYSLNDYKFLYSAELVSPQEVEHTEKMDKLFKYNMQQTLTNSGKKLRDWAGGYCGLWNYLYIFLLVINPHLDLSNIYTFFNKITTIKYNSMFCKLLIRNFAYYIENALINPNYEIQLAKIDINQLDDLNIHKVKFNSNSNEIELREMHSDNYYIKNNSAINNDDITFSEFIKTNIGLSITSVTKNFKAANNIVNMVKGFSKFIFSEGGLAKVKHKQDVSLLYTPDKINFLTV